jgi:hypothetical protein
MVYFDSEEKDVQISVQTVRLDTHDTFNGFCTVRFHCGQYI